MPSGIHAKMSTGIDQNFLDHSQMRMEILTAVSQVQNWISHQLTRAMIGSLSPTIRFYDSMRQSLSIAQ
jgi:hypothetical protein